MQKNKTALMKATELLARQEQSSNRLRQKLLARKYDAEEIDAAITALTERNYLNDAESCRRQFEYLYAEEKLSVRQICSKLIQRGFDSAFVKSLIPADSDEHDLKAARRAFEKKFSDAKQKNKIYQYLAGKGFSSSVISTLFEEEDL